MRMRNLLTIGLLLATSPASAYVADHSGERSSGFGAGREHDSHRGGNRDGGRAAREARQRLEQRNREALEEARAARDRTYLERVRDGITAAAEREEPGADGAALADAVRVLRDMYLSRGVDRAQSQAHAPSPEPAVLPSEVRERPIPEDDSRTRCLLDRPGSAR